MIPPPFRLFDPSSKSRLLSMVASPKRMTEGHRLRHDVAKALRGRLDVFGREYKAFNLTRDASVDHMFAVIIENMALDCYFSEKLIDTIIAGAVPIYRGCPSIGRFFEEGGIVLWTDFAELLDVVDTLSPAKYKEMLPALMRNRRLALAVREIEYYLLMRQLYLDPLRWIFEFYFHSILPPRSPPPRALLPRLDPSVAVLIIALDDADANAMVSEITDSFSKFTCFICPFDGKRTLSPLPNCITTTPSLADAIAAAAAGSNFGGTDDGVVVVVDRRVAAAAAITASVQALQSDAEVVVGGLHGLTDHSLFVNSSFIESRGLRKALPASISSPIAATAKLATAAIRHFDSSRNLTWGGGGDFVLGALLFESAADRAHILPRGEVPQRYGAASPQVLALRQRVGGWGRLWDDPPPVRAKRLRFSTRTPSERVGLC
jgi:hypothetical protein